MTNEKSIKNVKFVETQTWSRAPDFQIARADHVFGMFQTPTEDGALTIVITGGNSLRKEVVDSSSTEF